MTMNRVLVANRGEIACRVIRTLRNRGIGSAAIYSEIDAAAPHVLIADRARCVGPAPAAESYLRIDSIIEAAREMDCDAIHPGYGFLAENPEFAEACQEAGIKFIGPGAEAIRQMGDKGVARGIAEAAGVPPVPGYSGEDDPARLAREADTIGYPILVKAARGGGGKGMRRVDSKAELADAMTGARREALSAFGDETLIIEKLIHPARHVEVQIFGDLQGTVVSLLERECSFQRRHQKVIEECPSSAVDEDLRRRLGEAACSLARAVTYVGAGTVEFLLGPDGEFYFLEMNTRLQVEHGVTEMTTGLDLVSWQLDVAAGLPLPAGADTVTPRGHAIEARVYAEDPCAGFLPQAGLLEQLSLPVGPGIRVDVGVRAGQEISPFYDPLLMKVLAYGSDRESSRQRLVQALLDTSTQGPATNVDYLAQILESTSFRTGRTFTHTLETDLPPEEPAEPPQEVLLLAAATLHARGLRAPLYGGGASGSSPEGSEDPWSPFGTEGPFRIVPTEPR